MAWKLYGRFPPYAAYTGLVLGRRAGTGLLLLRPGGEHFTVSEPYSF